jgi:hypothetical protein
MQMAGNSLVHGHTLGLQCSEIFLLAFLYDDSVYLAVGLRFLPTLSAEASLRHADVVSGGLSQRCSAFSSKAVALSAKLLPHEVSSCDVSLDSLNIMALSAGEQVGVR